MHAYTPENSIFDGPITTLLSVLCILVEVLSRTHAKKGKSLSDFKSGTSIGRFSSDGAASRTAVKGLTVRDTVTRQRPQDTTFEEKGQAKQRIEPTLSAYQPNALPLGQTGSAGALAFTSVHRVSFLVASLHAARGLCP